MRAPFEHATAFAIESAMDELSYAVGMDPIELRLLNDTKVDGVTGLPHSTRYVAECLKRGGETFGWARRVSQPRSMMAPNGDLLGMGVAIGLYNGSGGSTRARITARRDGRMAINWGSSSAMPATDAACDALLKALADLGVDMSADRPLAASVALSGREEVEAEAATFAPGQTEKALGRTDTGRVAPSGPVYPDFVVFSYAAHFVEVHAFMDEVRPSRWTKI